MVPVASLLTAALMLLAISCKQQTSNVGITRATPAATTTPTLTSTPSATQTPSVPREVKVVRNKMGMELVNVLAGSFMMGSDVNDNEKPAHQVTIGKDFYMGRYEVTQAQWQAVMDTTVREQRDKANPSLDLAGEGDKYPMYYVNWDEAQEFIKKLNAQNDGYTYRLPSEAEWEYACRAGTTGDYAGNLDAMAWYNDNTNGTLHPVGQKQPNAWGLYDMHGNVLEWCQDWYHDSYNGAPMDGSAWVSGGGQKRILRGGSAYNHAIGLRSAERVRTPPDNRSNIIGFRLVAAART
jgi:formylglycine-generating enzyme required for sulfatase activity